MYSSATEQLHKHILQISQTYYGNEDLHLLSQTESFLSAAFILMLPFTQLFKPKKPIFMLSFYFLSFMDLTNHEDLQNSFEIHLVLSTALVESFQV